MKRVSLLVAALVVGAISTAVAFGAAGTKQGNTMPVIDVAMDGNSISVTGNLVSGAVDIHSTTTGAPGSGAPLFIRLNPGVTADQVVAVLQTKKANDPNVVADYGSIVFDPGPGIEDVQTILQPADYVAFDSAKNNPANWPYTTFTIADNKSPATLPAAQEWQKSVEFKFRGPSTLHTGQIIRATNAGYVVHMIIGIQVKDQASGRKVVKALRAGDDRQVGKFALPGFFSLFGPLSHGAVAQFTLNAKPGWYVEACFMDTQDGREHTRLGMERVVHIVK